MSKKLPPGHPQARPKRKRPRTRSGAVPFERVFNGTAGTVLQGFRPDPCPDLPPDTTAYPWPLKAAWWLDGLPGRCRGWLARQLSALAQWVAP